jgi:hypothetical protein
MMEGQGMEGGTYGICELVAGLSFQAMLQVRLEIEVVQTKEADRRRTAAEAEEVKARRTVVVVSEEGRRM